jgi:hypothetical protein
MRWKRLLLVMAIVAVAVAAWYWRSSDPFSGPVVRIRGGDIRSVEVREYVRQPGQKERISGGPATDPKTAEALALALRGQGDTLNHLCTSDGKLVIELRDGTTLDLELLVGHFPGRYEYRTKHGTVSMDRAALLAAFKPFGVAQLPGGEQAAMDGR